MKPQHNAYDDLSKKETKENKIIKKAGKEQKIVKKLEKKAAQRDEEKVSLLRTEPLQPPQTANILQENEQEEIEHEIGGMGYQSGLSQLTENVPMTMYPPETMQDINTNQNQNQNQNQNEEEEEEDITPQPQQNFENVDISSPQPQQQQQQSVFQNNEIDNQN